MNNQPPTIFFYLPEVYWQVNDDLLLVLNHYLDGSMTFAELWEWHVMTHPSLKSDGLFAWIVQPYLYLKIRGLSCELTSQIPTQGIAILPRKFVDNDLKPGAGCVFVLVKSDCTTLKYAQIHLVENPNEGLMHQNPSKNWKSFFIPHFPQPGLRPRDSKWGDRFQNIAYFGLDTNLAPQLRTPEWGEHLASLGFNWQIIERAHWHDYTNVDAVVAVRSFDSCTYNWKPASKLYNAWHGGVPAILGAESSFRSERRNPLDYIEVTSSEQIIDSLISLREDKRLRQEMIDNGRNRAEDTKPDRIADQWEKFLEQEAIPYYHRWLSLSKFHQNLFILIRSYDVGYKNLLRSRFLRVRGQSQKILKSIFSFYK